jgi:hypothetical protein
MCFRCGNFSALKDKFIKITLLFTVVFIVILGFALLGISFLPFQLVKAQIGLFTYLSKDVGVKASLDISADAFTPIFFDKLVVRMRFLATALFLVGVLIFLARNKLLQYVSDIKSSIRSFFQELGKHFCESIQKEDKIHLFSLLLIVLIAIAVRLFFLFRPILHDEAYTFVYYASKPLYIGLTHYSSTNNHLFNTFWTHIAYVFLGNKPWVLRLPALFAGVLIVPAAYLVIRIFYNKYAALMTSGIVASSAVLISYSTLSRGYTLLCLIFLLILALAKYLMQTRNQAAWLLFAVLSTLGFYTIPIMLYPFGIVVVWLSLAIMVKDTNLNRDYLIRNLFISLVITVILTLTLYAPVFTVSGLKALIANKWVASVSWQFFISKLFHQFSSAWLQWNDKIPSAAKFLLLIGFLMSLIIHKRLSTCRIPIILSVVIWCLPVLIIQRVIPFTRVWLFLLPLYAGLACVGISYILLNISPKLSNYRSFMFAVLTIVLSIWLSLNVIHKGLDNRGWVDAENITLSLKEYLKPGDRVLCILNSSPKAGSQAPMAYYFKFYGMSFNYLKSDLSSSRRIFIISQHDWSQQELIKSLQELLDKEGLAVTSFSIPKLIHQYRLKDIYEINRL